MQKNKNPFHFLDTYCIRTPLLSLTSYVKFVSGDHISEASLYTMWDRKEVKEALFLASPNVYDELEKWSKSEIKDHKKKLRIQQTFIKYIARASARCTPFGLFSGVAMGNFDQNTHIELEPLTNHSRHTRFDMHFLVALSDWLVQQDEIKNQLLFFPNTTLYQIADQYRYIEYKDVVTKKEYSIEGIKHTSYLQDVLGSAVLGKTIRQLAGILVNDDITITEAIQFIEQLISNQVLVSEIGPSLCGDDLLVQFIKILNRLEDVTQYTAFLTTLQSQLHTIDTHIGNDISVYTAIQKQLKETQIPFEQHYLFQTDLFQNYSYNTINKKHVYTIQKVIPILNKIRFKKENTPLDQFQKAFEERYETREVALVQALDLETGIGYIQHQGIADTAPFLNDITLPSDQKGVQEVSLSLADEIIYKKYLQTLQEQQYTMVLTDEDFKTIDTHWDDLPDTMSAMAMIVILDGKEQVVLKNVSGVSAANMLGRFAHGDLMILDHVQTITQMEEQMNDQVILAEIVHLPESRIGNVVRRPNIRTYEIPYLAVSSKDQEYQIPIDDLMIRIRNKRICLRSKKLNKEVRPRLTNMHNYKHNNNTVPIYHFLCDLQTQQMRSGLGFSWKSIKNTASFLPRVTYKNVILSPAEWKVTTTEIVSSVNFDAEVTQLLDAIEIWRISKQIPQWVQLVVHDHTLLINLKNYTTLQMVWDMVKHKENFVLREFLHTEYTIVKKEQEQFTNEFLVTFYNEEKLKRNKDNALSVLR